MSLDWGTVDPEELHPAFRMDVEGLFARLPDHWKATYGKRSALVQKVLWEKYKAGGPRAAPPGQSAHEFGLAIDVVLDDHPETVRLEPNWNVNDPRWLAMSLSVFHHPRLHSGRTFGDAGHIEALGWKNYPQVLESQRHAA